MITTNEGIHVNDQFIITVQYSTHAMSNIKRKKKLKQINEKI